jgi:uncharacterized protein YndB with AHSA1/START domain
MTAAKANPTQDRAFTISRSFDAPRDVVWKVHTACNHLTQWWGPKGFTMHHCKIDLRQAGVFHYGLRSPNGHAMWGRLTYREIAAPERLVFVVSFSDEQGGVTRHPMSPTSPLEILSTMSFTEQAGKTTLTIRWAPINPTAEEERTFDAGHDGMRQGFTGTLDQLAEYLAKA